MRIEIAHDALAKTVYDKGSSSDKALLKAIRMVHDGFNNYLETKAYLNRETIRLIEPVEEALVSSVQPEIYQFLKKSQRYHRRRLISVIALIIVIFLCLIAGLIHINNLKNDAENQKDETIRQKGIADAIAKEFREKTIVSLYIGKAIQEEETSPEIALKLILAAQQMNPKDENIDKLARLVYRRNDFISTSLVHRSTLMGVSFSPSGKQVATASIDRMIRIWNNDGELQQVLKGHRGIVNGIDFHPKQDTLLVSSSDDSTAIVWNLNTQKPHKILRGHKWDVNDAKYSPSGKRILTGSRDKTAILWTADGERIKEFKGNKDNIYKVAFSKNEKYIATASKDGTVMVWDTTGNIITTLKHPSSVYGIAFSTKKENELATGDRDGVIRIWEIDLSPIKENKKTSRRSKRVFRKDKAAAPREFRAHTKAVKNIAYSPSGDTLASSSEDRSIKLWSVNQGEVFKSFERHQGEAVGLDYSQNGSYLLSGSKDATAKIWNLEPKQNIKNFKSNQRIQCVDFSNNGKYALIGSWDNSIRLWDIKAKKEIFKKKLPSDVEAIDFHPSENLFAVASGRNVWTYNFKGKKEQTFRGHTGTVKTIKFSKDGERLLTGGRDNIAILWNTANGDKISTCKGHRSDILSLDFLYSNDTLVTSSWDGTIRLWDTKGTLLGYFNAHEGQINTITCHPKKALILSGGMDGAVNLWDLTNFKSLDIAKDKKVSLIANQSFRTSHFTNALQFVVDENSAGESDKFIWGGTNNEAQIWSLNGEVLQTYSQRSQVHSVAMSKDLSYILIGTKSDGATIYITFEGFLKDNDFNRIISLDRLKAEIVDIDDLETTKIGDYTLKEFRELAYYLDAKGTETENLTYLEKAKEVYDIILKKNSDSLEYHQAAQLYGTLAWVKLKKKEINKNEAYTLINQAYKIAPNNPDVIADKALIEVVMGNLKNAEELYLQLRGVKSSSSDRTMLNEAGKNIDNIKDFKLITEETHKEITKLLKLMLK